ncbi:hypothetical protein BDN72DRAFT_573646 [Pluteus cervinus]|uniref:Uncharacterized protein n=1 Tax=Pluteus cervinus TaxID=181527 RepID=A0ACD3A2G7_9AGAR|nr:hypothetical protein BDN72DRAFT_573646 [Pluteus cervinus]
MPEHKRKQVTHRIPESSPKWESKHLSGRSRTRRCPSPSCASSIPNRSWLAVGQLVFSTAMDSHKTCWNSSDRLFHSRLFFPLTDRRLLTFWGCSPSTEPIECGRRSLAAPFLKRVNPLTACRSPGLTLARNVLAV